MPPDTLGKLRGSGENEYNVKFVVVKFPQGKVKCAPTRVEEV